MANQLNNFVPLSSLDDKIQRIIARSREMRSRAYCPYSKFAVGSALLCDDGSVVEGCNVENLSYGLTICAERNAIFRAVADGKTKILAVAVCAEMKDQFVGPCGACRQVLTEFNVEMDVYLCKPDDSDQILHVGLEQLMPLSFNPRWVSFDN